MSENSTVTVRFPMDPTTSDVDFASRVSITSARPGGRTAL